MNMILWLFAGAALGWAAYALLGFNAAWGGLVSGVIGAIGGVLGGKLIAPLFFGPPDAQGVAMSALLVAALVSAAGLAASNLLHNRLES